MISSGESVLSVGQVIDRYEILSVIGEGGMAVVLEVRHRELGTRHAMKVLQISFPGIHERLLHEGQVQAAIRHPNVCRVTDVVRVAGAPGLVMELVEGPAVDGLLQSYQPNLPQIDGLARGILAGVRAAHQAGVVHRDLKPGNVLVSVQDDRVVPKVTDFGLAKALDDGAQDRGRHATRSGTHMGTPTFMAPEQFRDAKRADHRADLFSLGCLLYELVSGTPAFAGEDVVEIYERTSKGLFTPVRDVAPNIPDRMARAITSSLAPDPDERPVSCDALLELWCGGVPDEAVDVAWEASHLTLVKTLAPTRGSKPTRSSVTIAPSVPGASDPPAALPAAAAYAPSTAPLAPVPTRRHTVFGVAAGLGAVGLAVIVLAGLVLTGVGGYLSTRRAETQVVAVPVPLAMPAVSAPVVEPPPVVVEAPAQDPAPAPAPVVHKARTAPKTPTAAAPTTATVAVDGVSRSRLLASNGGLFKPGQVPPGSYVLFAFFEEAQPTRVLTFDVAAGETRTVTCNTEMKSCR